MLKGVNHQMIELTEINHPYFERAFLLLRPDCHDPNLQHLQEEARRLLTAVGGYTALEKNRRRARRIRVMWSLFGAAVGLILGTILPHLLP